MSDAAPGPRPQLSARRDPQGLHGRPPGGDRASDFEAPVSGVRRLGAVTWSGVRGVLRVPVLRFLCFGALLFALDARFGEAPSDALVLTAAERQRLREGFEAERGRVPSSEEERALWEGWAEEEAMLRHARELGLDEADVVVRRRLLQDVEFLLEAEAAGVSERSLRAYYDAHREAYQRPARRSFDHIFVSGSDRKARERAANLRARAATSEEGWRGLGDPSVRGSDWKGLQRERLSVRLGEEVAQAAFDLPQSEWSEPLASPLGYHLLRVVEHEAAALRPFEDVRDEVVDAQAADSRRVALARGRKVLRARYTLELP